MSGELVQHKEAQQLVSCLCVSRPERWGQLQRSIADFDLQTYPNRELIVVTDQKTDYATLIESYVLHDLEQPLHAPIKVFTRPLHSQLDGLLFAMCQAKGDVIAIWDDDNLNHPQRLVVQMDAQRRFPNAMTAFGESLYYFHGSNELFSTAYERPDAPASERCAISTLMGPRDVFPAIEPQFRAKPMEMLVNSMSRAGKKLVTLSGPSSKTMFMHVVGVTADNQRSYDLHRRLAQDRGRKAEWLNKNKEQLIAALDGYKWDVPTVDVVGTDASAFKYEAKARWPESLFPLKVKDDSVEELTEHVSETA